MVVKMMKKVTDRVRKWKCVRFDDNNGFSTKFNKTHFPDQSRREMYYYSVKCVEQKVRGFSPTIVATKKRFQMFQKVSEGLNLKPLPEGFKSFSRTKKRETVEKLIDKFDNDLAAAMTHGPVQADYLDDMQVGEGSGPHPASEGVANSSRPPDDSSLQNFLPGSVRREGSLRDPPGLTLDLGRSTLGELDNPEGRPPPSSRQCPDEFNQSMSDVECRASRYPDMLREFELFKQLFILYVNKLKDREMNERLSVESRSNLPRRSLQEIPSQLPEGILAEDPQNQLRKDAFQDVGLQGSDYPASDFGVKNIGIPMPPGEEDGLLRNRSISEALEVVPRLTGRLKKNVEDIRPEVYGGSADGDLPSKPIMEVSPQGFIPQPSDRQVSSGMENFVIMPNPGGSNTLQSLPIDTFVSTEPSADDIEMAKWCLALFDKPVDESLTYLWQPVSIDTLPA